MNISGGRTKTDANEKTLFLFIFFLVVDAITKYCYHRRLFKGGITQTSVDVLISWLLKTFKEEKEKNEAFCARNTSHKLENPLALRDIQTIFQNGAKKTLKSLCPEVT